MRLPLIQSKTLPPLGSRLLGSPTESTRRQRRRVRVLLALPLLGLNVVAAVVVGTLLAVVIPGPDLLARRFWLALFLIGPIYLGVAFSVGIVWGSAVSFRSLRWVWQERPPTRREQVRVLTLPWQLTLMQAVMWLGGMAAFTIPYGILDPRTIPKVAFTVAFAGIVICGFSYAFSEFALRPVAARALEPGDPRRVRWTGLRGRGILAWVPATGAPIAGLMVSAIFSLVDQQTSVRQLCVEILAIGSITLVFGFTLARIGTKATVDPIRSVTNAMTAIGRGELETRIAVYDGTEIGELQSGFNHMADGLRERERIRDLFGRHVGHQVAEEALRGHPELGGEERTVAMLFIDLIGSTQLASSRPPREVVALLNVFFDVVVSEVDSHHGFINKFEGDAALAIFGAPVELDDSAGQALAAARAIHRRLTRDVPDCDAAIGVAYGLVVAGNIGARNRFEYTIIGDPVNEAARLCELAKSEPGRVLASESAVAAAPSDESTQWKLGDAVVLRGRSQSTRLASPTEQS